MKQAGWSSILVALALLGAGVIAEAQQAPTRIGYLDNTTASASAELLEDFRKQMIQLNWIVGKNLAIEYRYAGGNNDRLPELAIELVALKVELILTNTINAALAAKKATGTIPIVMVGVGDAVAQGL